MERTCTSGQDDREERAEEDGEKPNEDKQEPGPKERRLDDFWNMTLKRPTLSEIIRKAIYLTRQQQFREMCEEVPAVKALNFLQNDVSMTVDHNDPEEANVFRSLLSYLLDPSKPSTRATSRRPSDLDTADVDSDSEDNDAPPKKKSRQSTPEEAWTSTLDEDAASAENVALHRRVVSMNEDPEEHCVRDEANSLSAERFQQRTDVFESLMEFVKEGAKQPPGNLLDMMNAVGDDL